MQCLNIYSTPYWNAYTVWKNQKFTSYWVLTTYWIFSEEVNFTEILQKYHEESEISTFPHCGMFTNWMPINTFWNLELLCPIDLEPNFEHWNAWLTSKYFKLSKDTLFFKIESSFFYVFRVLKRICRLHQIFCVFN